jgi:hypothetical protein
MLGIYFSAAKMLGHLRSGPSGPYLDGFAAALERQGYRPAIRRFLMHVLPKGFHRIRHYGLFANANRAASIARARELIDAAPRVVEPEEEKVAAPDQPRVLPCPCPRCGGRMIVIEVFARGCEPRHRPTLTPTSIRIDTS